MNDPHVKALHYAVTHSESVIYDNSGPLKHEEPGFGIQIENLQARIRMKDHYPTAECARADVEPFLRNWEFLAALQFGPDELAFRYESAEIIDRNPKPGNHVLHAETGVYAHLGFDAQMRIGRSKFPPPPASIKRDADVDLMFLSYQTYRASRRTLPDAAYLCLTVLERRAGGRRKAAAHYGVDIMVLKRLGELTATKGGPEARKDAGARTPLSGEERNWLEQATERLILRAAEVAFDSKASLPKITMADLSLA
jgi:hypothetical protein